MTGPNSSLRVGIALGIAAALTTIDQVTKQIALASLSTEDRIPLIGDLLGLQLAFNAGTVMSLGSQSTWIFTVLGSGAAIALLIGIVKTRSRSWALTFGVLLGGDLGNLADRFLAAPGFGRGHVTDFLAYGNIFIGNLADIFLLAGVVLLGLRLVASGRNEPARPDTTPSQADSGSAV